MANTADGEFTIESENEALLADLSQRLLLPDTLSYDEACTGVERLSPTQLQVHFCGKWTCAAGWNYLDGLMEEGSGYAHREALIQSVIKGSGTEEALLWRERIVKIAGKAITFGACYHLPDSEVEDVIPKRLLPRICSIEVGESTVVGTALCKLIARESVSAKGKQEGFTQYQVDVYGDNCNGSEPQFRITFQVPRKGQIKVIAYSDENFTFKASRANPELEGAEDYDDSYIHELQWALASQPMIQILGFGRKDRLRLAAIAAQKNFYVPKNGRGLRSEGDPQFICMNPVRYHPELIAQYRVLAASQGRHLVTTEWLEALPRDPDLDHLF